MESLDIETQTPNQYLACKERLVTGLSDTDHVLEFDIGPFNRDFPKLKEMRSIGRAVLGYYS